MVFPYFEYSRLDQYIPILTGNKGIHPIHKGYSGDRKFDVLLQHGQHALLRIFDLQHSDSKKCEFDVLVKMQNLGVICSAPIEFGQVTSLGIAYMILSYIEGNDAADELPKLAEHEQYRIGVEAGKELFKMHQWRAPDSMPSWYDSKRNKHTRYLEQYSSCGVRVRNDAKIISYIDRHMPLMKHRPNLFQHDDFHAANIIIKEKRLSGIIDFNRYDWGDPIHEFLKTGMFSSEISIPFSIGQIRGYHNGRDPDRHFWTLYSLYLAMCIFSSVVWILKVKPEELPLMMDKINRVLDDHNDFDEIVPRWYKPM